MVRQALAAVDDHWRLANAIFDERFRYAPALPDLQGLIDMAPGLSILDAERGSLFVWMRGEFTRAPLATVAAVAGIAAFLHHEIDVVFDRPEGATHITIKAPRVSYDTGRVLAERLRLPDGCSVTIDVRSESTDKSVPTVRIRPAHHVPVAPGRQLPEENPWWKATLPEAIPVDVPIPDGPFYIVILPTGSGLPLVLEVDEDAGEPVRHTIRKVQTHLADVRSASDSRGVTVVRTRTRTETDTQRLESWPREQGARTAPKGAV